MRNGAMKRTDLGPIQELLTRAIDCDRLKRGRRRQELAGRGERPDYAPLLLGYRTHSVPGLSYDVSHLNAEHFLDGGSAVPEIADHPHFTFGEQIESPNLGLYEALWGVLSWARSPGDAQLAIRPPMVDALMSCFGMKRLVNDQGTPWYPEPLTLDEALAADVDDLAADPQVQLALEHIRYYRQNIVPGVHVSCPIAIGPFTYIDLMLGRSLYTELYWQMDLYNLFHFVRLRLHAYAQLEIRAYASVLFEIMSAVCPIASASFEDHIARGVRFSGTEIAQLQRMLKGENADLKGRALQRFMNKLTLGHE